MKRILCLVSFLIAIALPMLGQATFTETLSVTNTPANITISKTAACVIVKENSNNPTATFSVTPAAASSVAVNLMAGQSYQFASPGTGGLVQFAAGSTLGTIQSTGSGPFTFVLMESNSLAPCNAVPSPSQSGSSSVSSNTQSLNGTTIDTNSGNKSAGTQRVVIATDQPSMTNPQPENLTQVGGTAIDTNSGNKSAGTQRVILATDQPQLTNPLLTVPPNVAGTDDPCANPHVLKASAIISQAASTQEIVATSASTVIYVCQVTLQLSGATSPAAQVKTGTNGGTPCSAGAVNLTPAFIGGATATPSVIPIGNGSAMVFKSIAGGEICVTGSGTSPSVFGVITYVQQ